MHPISSVKMDILEFVAEGVSRKRMSGVNCFENLICSPKKCKIAGAMSATDCKTQVDNLEKFESSVDVCASESSRNGPALLEDICYSNNLPSTPGADNVFDCSALNKTHNTSARAMRSPLSEHKLPRDMDDMNEICSSQSSTVGSDKYGRGEWSQVDTLKKIICSPRMRMSGNGEGGNESLSHLHSSRRFRSFRSPIGLINSQVVHGRYTNGQFESLQTADQGNGALISSALETAVTDDRIELDEVYSSQGSQAW